MFDSLLSNVSNLFGGGHGEKQFSFHQLPSSVSELGQLPEAAMSTPFETAALTVLALAHYPHDKDASLAMLDFLRGPRPLSGLDKQNLADRFRDKDYVPRSFFHGTSPDNNYQANAPYQLTVSENPYSYDEEGYAKLFLQSSGADSPRPIVLRKAKDGKWYLWEQLLLAGIRQPASSNPWA